MSGEPTVPVLCCGNNNKQYDGKTWIEKVKQIVEVNGETVDFSHVSDDDIPKLQHGDVVVIKYPRKGSKSFSLFRGIVNLEPTYPQSGPPSTSGELEEPKSAGSSASPGLRELVPRRKRKLKDVHAPSGIAGSGRAKRPRKCGRVLDSGTCCSDSEVTYQTMHEYKSGVDFSNAAQPEQGSAAGAEQSLDPTAPPPPPPPSSPLVPPEAPPILACGEHVSPPCKQKPSPSKAAFPSPQKVFPRSQISGRGSPSSQPERPPSMPAMICSPQKVEVNDMVGLMRDVVASQRHALDSNTEMHSRIYGRHLDRVDNSLSELRGELGSLRCSQTTLQSQMTGNLQRMESEQRELLQGLMTSLQNKVESLEARVESEQKRQGELLQGLTTSLQNKVESLEARVESEQKRQGELLQGLMAKFVYRTDLIVTKQDQLHCAVVGDTITPPMTSPRTESRLAWSGHHQRGGPQSVASVGKPVEPSLESTYQSDGLSYNFDTMLEDFGLAELFPNEVAYNEPPVPTTEILDASAGSALEPTIQQPTIQQPVPVPTTGTLHASAGTALEPTIQQPVSPHSRMRRASSAPATTSVSDPISRELMSPPLQPPRRLALPRTPRCTPAITAGTALDPACQQLMSPPLQPLRHLTLSAGTALDSACQQVVPPLEPPRQFPPPSLILPLAYSFSNLEETARSVALQGCGSKEEVDVGKVTCLLARTVYFGVAVLKQSTLKGKRGGLRALNCELVDHLKGVIRSTFFPNLSPKQFEEEVETKIDTSLSGLCRRARDAARDT